jgi:hypothetical protein
MEKLQNGKVGKGATSVLTYLPVDTSNVKSSITIQWGSSMELGSQHRYIMLIKTVYSRFQQLSPLCCSQSVLLLGRTR